MSSHLEIFNENKARYEAYNGPDGMHMPGFVDAGVDIMRSAAVAGAVGVAATAMPAAAIEYPHSLPADFTSAEVVESQEATSMATIIVQSGDSPASIARTLLPKATEIEVANAAQAIAQFNGIEINEQPNGTQIAIVHPGDVLAIPHELMPQPSFIYSVQKGDTLASIVKERLAEVGATDDLHHAVEVISGENGLTLTEVDGTPYVFIRPGQEIDLSAITPAGIASNQAPASETIGSEHTTPEQTIVTPAPPVLTLPVSDTANVEIGPPIYYPPDTEAIQPTAPESAPIPSKPEITSVDKIVPTQLGPQNNEGYYAMPDDEALYTWSADSYPIAGMLGTPKGSRCASYETVVATYSAMSALHTAYPDVRWVLGDFNQAEGHASHENGIDVDIYDEKGIGTTVVGDPDVVLNVMRAFALTGDVELFFFSSEEMNNRFNEWAEAHNIATRAKYADGHDRHIHVRMLANYRGKDSATCAPDTVYANTQEAVATVEVPAAVEDAAPTQKNSEVYTGVLSLTSPEFRELMNNIPTYEYAAEHYSSGDGKTEWGPRISIDDIAVLCYNAGWRGDDLAIAIALAAFAEGGSAPFVINPAAGSLPGYPEDTVAVGLLQMLARPDWEVVEPIRNRTDNLNPIKNVNNAHALWIRQGWKNGWEAYMNGKHEPHMDKAHEAADRLFVRLAAAGLN